MHGSPSEVRVTKALTIKPETLYTVEVSLFMRSLLQLLDTEAGGRLDILGCNVAQGEAGAQFISELESVYSVNVAASDDATAAIRRPPLCCGANDMDRENDMILETDGVDVTQVRAPWLAPPAASAHGLFTAQVYFDATIAQWSGQLGGCPLCEMGCCGSSTVTVSARANRKDDTAP